MNWKKLIQDLLDAGMTQAEVARGIKVKPPSVFEILNAPDDKPKTMRWENGDRLIKLHKRLVRKAA